MHTVSHSILLNTNSIQSSDIKPPDQFSHGRKIKNSIGCTTKIIPTKENMPSSISKLILDSRAVNKSPDPDAASTWIAPPTNQISITDAGKSFDSDTLWEDVEYYLQRLINVSSDHLEKAKHYLLNLSTGRFEHYEDLIDHLVLLLNEKEGTDYPLMDEVEQENSHSTVRNKKISSKVWDLCKFMTTALAAESVMSGVISPAAAAAIPLNGTVPASARERSTTYKFVSDRGFDPIVTQSGHSMVRGLPDTCVTRRPTENILFGVVNGETICIPDGGGDQNYAVAFSDNQKSITVSTGHGHGDLKLEVKNGKVSGVSDQPGSNTECVVIKNPQSFQTEITITGNREKASLAVDFNTNMCRLPIRRGFADKTEIRTDGYPFKSAHLLIYEIEFADAKINWPNLAQDLDGVNNYFKRQSYGDFDIARDVIKVKLGESIEQYSNTDWTEWRDRYHDIVKESGIDPKNPGGNRIILMISPYIENSTATAGHSLIATNDREQGVATLAHQMADAMGLRHANALESGSEIIRTMPDDDSWYNCRGKSSCTEEKNAYLVNTGNVFDLMGTAPRNEAGEMNLLYKSFFGWVDLNTDVPLVTASGRYRIYAFDHGEKSNGPVGLRIRSGNCRYTYWLEYRTTEPYADNNKQGVLVNLEGYAENDKDPKFWKTTSYLLDMTPESKNATRPNWWGDDYTDAALGLGRSFEDKWGAFKIRPYRVGGKEDSANAWIEVDVVTKANGLVFPDDINTMSSTTPTLVTTEVHDLTTTALPASGTLTTGKSTDRATTGPTSASAKPTDTLTTVSPDHTVQATSSPTTKRQAEIRHNVAVIYLKEHGEKPRFHLRRLHERIVNQLDSLIRSNSYQKEGFAKVDKFGWYNAGNTKWNEVLRSKDWAGIKSVVRAQRSGALDLKNHDYVITVWDDKQQIVDLKGEALPHKKDIMIDGRTYREKYEIAKYLKPNDLQNHCFYERLIFTDLERCYTNPVGGNLKEFEDVLFHEFLHTKRLAHHSATKYCENFLLGSCRIESYNRFDALSSERLYGNSLNAFDKYWINWLADENIISLKPESGHHEVTLHHLSSQDYGKKAVKIDYQEFMGSDIWLESRQPTELDYGLFDPVFDKVRSGLLVYENNLLLDATPETKALDDQTDVSITSHFSFAPLGLNIDIIDIDPANGTVRCRIDLTATHPVRNPPLINFSRCNYPGACRVLGGASFETQYMAEISDFGYGNQVDKAWAFNLTGLPAGISWVNDGVKRVHTTDANLYSRTPHTFMLFSVDTNVLPDTYEYTMRFIHPDDQSKYVDLRQFLTVLG